MSNQTQTVRFDATADESTAFTLPQGYAVTAMRFTGSYEECNISFLVSFDGGTSWQAIQDVDGDYVISIENTFNKVVANIPRNITLGMPRIKLFASVAQTSDVEVILVLTRG